MGKIYEQTINRFDGGMSEDKRVQNPSKFSITKHFDTNTYPHKLVPRNKTQALTGEDKTKGIIRLLYNKFESSYVMWGFGAGTASKGMLYYYNTNTQAWAEPDTNGISASARDTRVFFYYRDYIYIFGGGTSLFRAGVVGGTGFNTQYQAVSYTNLAEPVHHLSDDCAYFFHDNIVSKHDGSTWTPTALTLPSNIKITCAASYGNYLAIGTTTLGSLNNKSTVFLWDRDTSLTTVSERIDFGSGTLRHLAVLDNKLIGVVTDLGYNSGRVFIKQASGTSAVIINELSCKDPSTSDFPDTRVIKDNKLYFPMSAELNGDTRFGIWVVDGNGKLTLDTIEEEATSYEFITLLEDQWWIIHSQDYSSNVSVTDESYSTTLSSVYETLILNGGDSSQKKKLVGVTVMTEPLPTAGSIVLKYRKDESTSWTTIFTNSTDNSISHSAVNIESSGDNLPEFKELQFQVNSLGGAVITGLKYQYEEIPSDIYQNG